jgi:Ser-tRNA(Ala) deacylase AlaX
MATKLLYLEGFDIVSCEAEIVGLNETEDGRTVMVLDQTCFYPRGGGQDWDTGDIKSGNNEFLVEEVRLDEQGDVHHIGRAAGNFKPGEAVKCSVNTQRRSINTRLHSAGHVIDMAMSSLRPYWVPVRGGHYPHMSFVEYQVPPATQIDEAFQPELQEIVNKLSKSNYQNQLRFIDKAEMAKYYPHVPDNIPANKPSRIVLYADDFGIPCGGTHVQSVQEIGQINLTKIKIKKGLAKVSYAVAGIN